MRAGKRGIPGEKRRRGTVTALCRPGAHNQRGSGCHHYSFPHLPLLTGFISRRHQHVLSTIRRRSRRPSGRTVGCCGRASGISGIPGQAPRTWRPAAWRPTFPSERRSRIGWSAAASHLLPGPRCETARQRGSTSTGERHFWDVGLKRGYSVPLDEALHKPRARRLRRGNR